jgi:alpha-ketoglutarate-dependent 2,4-dichlorophenoxyacetate dioxygenase
MTTYNKKALPGVGYEYFDLDLQSMSTDEVREFGKVLIEDNVVLLRNQKLDDRDDIVRVAHAIGRTMQSDKFFNDDKHKGLGRVTNQRDENGKKIGLFADKDLDWHSNGNNRDTGRECCVMLYCIRPGVNSITSFADTRKAYQDLPDDIKELLDDVDCNFKFKNNTFYHLDEGDQELEFFENSNLYPEGLVKPLVYQHPFSKEKGLYFTFHSINKMWRRSGEPLDEAWLRQYLYDHVFQDKYIYHHDSWQHGDMIFMDQFHSIHRRNEVQGDRFMWRLTVDYSKSLRHMLIEQRKTSE